jgi:hypothetical protein
LIIKFIYNKTIRCLRKSTFNVKVDSVLDTIENTRCLKIRKCCGDDNEGKLVMMVLEQPNSVTIIKVLILMVMMMGLMLRMMLVEMRMMKKKKQKMKQKRRSKSNNEIVTIPFRVIVRRIVGAPSTVTGT